MSGDGAAPPIAIVGSTASGKSAVALEVAERRGDVELVSIDSMQVYRGMDIGTAKATAADRSRVRHHLLDLIDPDEEFTVAEFQRAARAAIAEIAGRGRRALLVGGTGLYHRAVIDDLDLPGEWPQIRSRLLGEVAEVGPEVLHARLAELDPAAASRMEPTNLRRIVRALEVCEGSGRRFSSFGPGLDVYADTGIVQFGLRWERSALSSRIGRRVAVMVSAGLFEEVARIRSTTGFSRTAAQALGYKEVLAHLDGAIGRDEAIEEIVLRTRQFAVRQERWFRRDPRVTWLDIDADPVREVVPAVLAALHTS